jgi:plasmid stabilization system protein ParE
MVSKYRYKLTERAVNDLDDVIYYISSELSNPSAAANFMETLQNTIENICNFPESGSRVINEFIPNENIRRVLLNNYIMYYMPDIDSEMIYILRIVYAHRDMNKILKNIVK